MPSFIILICTLLATILLTVNYGQRFYQLSRKTYAVNPLTPLVWIFSSVLAVIFLLASQNFVLAALSGLALIYQAIFFIFGAIKMRKVPRKWKVRKIDFICFALAIFASVVFRVTGDANFGAAIIFAGKIFGELPQLRKAFTAPETDSISIYLIAAARYLILFGTLENINFVGLSQSIFWAIFIFVEGFWIWYCQRRLGRKI